MIFLGKFGEQALNLRGMKGVQIFSFFYREISDVVGQNFAVRRKKNLKEIWKNRSNHLAHQFFDGVFDSWILKRKSCVEYFFGTY